MHFCVDVKFAASSGLLHCVIISFTAGKVLVETMVYY